MTFSEANRMLSAPLFDKNELALMKLLVLESLSKYDSISEANCKGNIYKLLITIRTKIHELNNEL
tara:strand:- start:1829 stop:2023 length:195 start_codon:yes stop_codon:yes gene_type:complete